MLNKILGMGSPQQSQPMIGSAERSPMGNMLNTVGAGDILGLEKKAAPDNSNIQAAQDAMTGAGSKSAGEMDALNAQAKAAGFPSYEAMVLFQKQKQRNHNNGSQVEDEGSWWDNAMAWHPKNLLEYVNNKLRGATE